jgi:Zn-dependent M28 family amino/carboxypeptidase
MGYDPKVTKIPAAAVTTEDADLLVRLSSEDSVTVTLNLGSKILADVPSANVIGELRGRERPEEIVLIGAHLDSWDVGQGAHDDGSGCVHVMQALTVLRRLGLTPRRTIRVVLYTNEENGLRGADAYAADHAAEIANHVAAIESDAGGFAPRGFELHVDSPAEEAMRARLQDIASLFESLGAATIEKSDHAGSDIEALVERGVAGLGFLTDSRTYFDFHHTAADTLDKVDPAVLADGVAVMAMMAYVLAEMPEPLHRPAVPAPTAAPGL